MTFQLNSNGATFSDRGGNSHGDTPDQREAHDRAQRRTRTSPARSPWTLTDVATDPDLSKKNPQASTVTPPVSKIPVTVEDGLVTYGGAGTDPCGTAGLPPTASVTGRGSTWITALHGPVKVTLMLYGPSVPDGATTSNIKLFHEGSSPNPITTPAARRPCPRAPVECITVTKVGNNFKIVGWLNHNGYIRGGY